MKPLHRRRIALGTLILLALMSFLLLLWKLGSRRQGAEVLADESASLRSGQPLLGRAREPGARYESGTPLRNEPGAVAESDEWLKEDPKVRILVCSIDKVVPKDSSTWFSWIEPGVIVTMEIRPTWVNEDQVEWDGEMHRQLLEHDHSVLADYAWRKEGLLNEMLFENCLDDVAMVISQRMYEKRDPAKELGQSPFFGDTLAGKYEFFQMLGPVARPGMDATCETSETIVGSLIGARVTVKAKRMQSGTATRGQVILRHLIKQPVTLGP